MILNEPAAQKEAFNLASLLTNVNPYNLSKPDIHRRAVATNDDILEAFSGLRIGLRILINPKFFSSFATSTRTREGEFCESIKKGLPTIANPVYGYSAPAKSGAGIGVLIMLQATHDAPSVFFCVLASAHLFPSDMAIAHIAQKVMVGWMGAERSAPVSCNAGYANPVQLTTSEIGVSGGGNKSQLQEAAIMATTPTQKPQFIWIIAAVRRDCPTITAKIHHIAAESERDARRSLVRDHICFFAGRIRMEVAHD
ncbi:host cell division inhibitor Icd-like protein [Escherichia coli]|uniref:host cell division inhibitor Icd-like protein n=3 Tax=Escherichia coli TaxID=562 RepID=UPI00202F89D5|nr:host cell division inhibitor Icd-like protein [Escherichia coli]MDD8806168.1 host cell division inhibitor Icd-like protein [Escherichia coli]MDV1782315.1 host cell division inhibitor Icd-like protein [Escherichia coli]MDV1787060.1 host cell division inhibitor Icd-like protein [Escherichia coli]MDV1825082.1 host cell division inhibitor Icd-like protein [Escherichia coli]MDV1844001.1 host cell division inhibitor Icd-like protein [Escherichia coli]